MLKYGKKSPEQDERRNKSGPRYNTNNSGFQWYLTIEAVDKPETENIIISVLVHPPEPPREIDPEMVKRKLWVLKIVSKQKPIAKYSFSRTAYNCRIVLSIIRDNKTLSEGLSLHWRGSKDLPRKCNYTGPSGRQQHANELPNSYVARVLAETSEKRIPSKNRK